MPEDFDKELARRIRKNEEAMELIEGEYENAFDASFADPAKANETAERIAKDDGENALFEALKAHPDTIGPLPEDRAAFDKAIDQRMLLPGLFLKYRVLRDKTDALRRTQEIRAKAAAENGSSLSPTAGTSPEAIASERSRIQTAQKEWKEKKRAAGQTAGSQKEDEWEPTE